MALHATARAVQPAGDVGSDDGVGRRESANSGVDSFSEQFGGIVERERPVGAGEVRGSQYCSSLVVPSGAPAGPVPRAPAETAANRVRCAMSSPWRPRRRNRAGPLRSRCESSTSGSLEQSVEPRGHDESHRGSSGPSTPAARRRGRRRSGGRRSAGSRSTTAHGPVDRVEVIGVTSDVSMLPRSGRRRAIPGPPTERLGLGSKICWSVSNEKISL